MKKKNCLKPKRLIAAAFPAVLFMALFCVISQNNGSYKDKSLYEHKNHEYDMTVESDNVKIDEKATSYAKEYANDVLKKHENSSGDTYSFYDGKIFVNDEQPITHEAINLTADNIYSSEDAIDWDSIPYNTFVYCYDENGGIKMLRRVPNMNKVRLESLYSHIDAQPDFTIDRHLTAEVGDNFLQLDYNMYSFNSKTKVVVDEDGSELDMPFDVSECDTNLDFLEQYLNSENLPNKFTSKDEPVLTYLKDTYSFSDDCNESVINDIASEFDMKEISSHKLTYSVCENEIDEEVQLTYISLEVYGTNNDGVDVSIYVTYGFSNIQ